MLGGYSAKVTTIFTVTPEFNDHTAYTKWLVRMAENCSIPRNGGIS